MNDLPTTFPRVPLKKMDPALLWFELDRDTHRLMPEACEMVTSAATLASFLHRNQTRSVRGDLPRVPYIEHPLRVALRLIRWGVRDGEVIAAALLHDVLEDCHVELLEVFGDEAVYPGETAPTLLGRLYGDRVACLVEEVTNPADGTSYGSHVEELATHPDESVLIKASDLKDNAGSIRHQIGYGEDARMLRRVRKYLPVLQHVVIGLETLTEDLPEKAGPAGRAVTELHCVRDHLVTIEAQQS